LPVEERRVCIVLTGPRQPHTFYSTAESNEQMDFGDIKGTVEALLARLGFRAGDIEFRAQPDTPPFGPRCAEVVVRGKPIGLLGEIHPRVRAAFDLPAVRINAAELDVAALVRPTWEQALMRPISQMPPVVEDLAFVVGEEVTLRQLEQAIRAGGGDLLADVELFDLYRGEPLPAGSKSLAFRVAYQSTDAILKEADVVKLRERIVRRVARETGGQLRS
jgi:phenylalanyl-tRNA synthetase beta chain